MSKTSEKAGLRHSLGKALLGDTARDRHNGLAVLMWTVIWGAAYTATLQSIRAGLAEGLVAWSLVALTAVATILAMRAYVRFVREADEMIRTLYVDALAFGFAAGAVFFAASELLAALGGPVYDSNELFTIMCLVFAGKVFWNMWRHR